MFNKTERQILQGLLDGINADFTHMKKSLVDLEAGLKKLREWKEEQDAMDAYIDNTNFINYIERIGAGV